MIGNASASIVTESSPVVGAVGSDTLLYWPGSNASGDTYRYLANASRVSGYLVQETNTNKFYFMPNSNLGVVGLAFDMGSTEPDFS